ALNTNECQCTEHGNRGQERTREGPAHVSTRPRRRLSSIRSPRRVPSGRSSTRASAWNTALMIALVTAATSPVTVPATRSLARRPAYLPLTAIRHWLYVAGATSTAFPPIAKEKSHDAGCNREEGIVEAHPSRHLVGSDAPGVGRHRRRCGPRDCN